MTSFVASINHPRALAGPLVGLSFVGGVAIALATAKSPYPRPGAPVDQIQTYFQGSATAARISVAGQLISSAALLPFTAAVAEVAGRSGAHSRLFQRTGRFSGLLISGIAGVRLARRRT